jgi:hypothetical protein
MELSNSEVTLNDAYVKAVGRTAELDQLRHALNRQVSAKKGRYGE